MMTCSPQKGPMDSFLVQLIGVQPTWTAEEGRGDSSMVQLFAGVVRNSIEDAESGRML